MSLCEQCKAECCRYITTIVDTPEDEEDWDEIKWMLMHEGVTIYVDEDDDWNVEVMTKCKHLGDDHKCMIYDKRPKVCRDHGTHECEENEDSFEPTIHFEKPEDVDEYLKKI
jgi:uncharacterized protein